MKVVKDPRQFAMWVEKNFADVEAVREVAANLGYFNEASADLLQNRLNYHPDLPPLLTKSWCL
jgi:hypothetical protein